MSSAKTIADILSFSELVDSKSVIGNPFTSQPMYVAACAFLMESTYYSSPLHASDSTHTQPSLASQSGRSGIPNMGPSSESERKNTSKHTLHASAAKENYQTCYKALKALEKYWEGTKYILTVLDQKAKGIVDPLLYTAEEMESTSDRPPIQPFAPPNSGQARRPHGQADTTADVPTEGRWSPKVDPNQGEEGSQLPSVWSTLTYSLVAIGWALAGAPNSTQPNLSLLYQMPTSADDSVSNKLVYSPQHNNNYASLPAVSNPHQNPYTQRVESQSSDVTRGSSIAAGPGDYSPLAGGGVTASDANLLLGLNTSYSESGAPASYDRSTSSSLRGSQMSAYPYSMPPGPAGQQTGPSHMPSRATNSHTGVGNHAGDVLIESQDIDVSSLHHQSNLPFALNGDVLPWLEYLPQDVLNYFGER